MRPETVEIKVTIATGVADAVRALDLTGAREWRISFCEDVTAAVTSSAELLRLGVVLRVRSKTGGRGDSTVKLRPCRWSQLGDDFASNDEDADGKLKIEADWAGDRHSLAAAMTTDWDGDRLDRVLAGDLTAAALFSSRQQDFLRRCAPGRVNLETLTALPPFPALRWEAFTTVVDGTELSIRAESWAAPGGTDFLELSIVSDPARAATRQSTLEHFVATRSLEPDPSRTTKTQRVLDALVSAVAEEAVTAASR